MEKYTLFWFRRDLRIEDNHGLFQALQGKNKVLPIFIFDPVILDRLPKKDARVEFILLALGVIFITICICIFYGGFDAEFFNLSNDDWIYIAILTSICTAYAFIAAVEVMKYISPFTVILSYNLEPVYGILLALYFFPENEQMSPQFYYGAIIVILAVILDAIIKNYRTKTLKKFN